MKHGRKFSNPDNIAEVAKDSGMALAAGAAAAAGAGLAMVGASRITYDATTPVADQAMYRTLAGSGMLALAGALMQYGSDHVAAVGKAMLVAAVVVPGSVFVANKVSSAMAPAVVNPLAPTTPSQGMYGRSGNLMGQHSPFLNPSGFAADQYGPFMPTGELSSSFMSPAYIPPAR